MGGLKTLFIPWINEDNQKETNKIISKTKCSVAMGHLELNGFKVNGQIVMDHGHDSRSFDKFEKVFSGHYHTRSDNGTVYYLGNPYEMFWSDVKDARGFTLFDTESLEHTPVNNPHRLFYNIYYEDTDHQTFNTTEYENKIVKVIVRKKSDIKKFEKFIDKIYSANIADLKIVEIYDFNGWYSKDEIKEVESENTLSLLNRYIKESEIDLDKSKLSKIVEEIYRESCEMI